MGAPCEKVGVQKLESNLVLDPELPELWEEVGLTPYN